MDHELGTPDGRTVTFSQYGPEDGHPVISHSGSPSTRWKRPEVVEVIERAGLCMLVPDRPGYGGSSRRPGRRVADVAADTLLLADAYGWPTFAVHGGSGGGPHALACAALLGGDRVSRCALVGGIRPAQPDGAEKQDESALRAQLEQIGRGFLDRAEAGGPEIPGGTGAARDDPAAMARLRAIFVDSLDGWVDDSLSFGQPWGFDPGAITVPVGVWHGAQDTSVGPEHAEWLLGHIPGAEDHPYAGGHQPDAGTNREIYAWLWGRPAGNERVGA